MANDKKNVLQLILINNYFKGHILIMVHPLTGPENMKGTCLHYSWKRRGYLALLLSITSPILHFSALSRIAHP